MAKFRCPKCGFEFSADLEEALCPACGSPCEKAERSLAFKVAAAVINGMWFLLKCVAAVVVLAFCGIVFLFAVLAGNRTLAGLILGGVAGYALAKVGLRGLEDTVKAAAKRLQGVEGG